MQEENRKQSYKMERRTFGKKNLMYKNKGSIFYFPCLNE